MYNPLIKKPCVCSVFTLALGNLVPQPRYLEDSLGRVVGGDVAKPNSWPWQVIYFNTTSKKKKKKSTSNVSAEDQWMFRECFLVCFFFFFPFRSLFSTDLAAITTTHAEEPWLRKAGWWQLLTVWTGNMLIINKSSDTLFFGCMSLRCTCGQFVVFWLKNPPPRSYRNRDAWFMSVFLNVTSDINLSRPHL